MSYDIDACHRKPYTKEEADAKVAKFKGKPFYVYKCHFCRYFHTTHRPPVLTDTLHM